MNLRRLLLLLLLPACLDAGQAPGNLRIASWNVENLLLQNRWEDGRYRFNYPKPEHRKKLLRQYLLQVRPDILLIQEVGSAAFLEELRLDLAASGLVYPHAHCAVSPGSRSGLGLLSMLPPDEILFHDPVPLPDQQDDPPAALRRGVQEIAFSVAGQRLRIFHVHLKSRYTSDPADPDSVRARTAELRALQHLLRPHLARPDAPFLLLAGDFNTPFADPLLDPLRRDWHPVIPADATGDASTYHHFRSGARETIDGFWAPHPHAAAFRPVALFPLHPADPPASDHRMVVVDFSLANPP